MPGSSRGALSPNQEKLLVLAAAAWMLLWGVTAILSNGRPSGPDGVFPRVWSLFNMLRFDGPGSFLVWIVDKKTHPPLPALYGTALAAIFGPSRETVRLGGLLLQLVLLFQVRGLILALTSCRTSAVLGCWLVAALPVTAGWFRMDFHEPMVSVLLMATLGMAARWRVHRAKEAALLGLMVGLGSLSKLGYGVFILAPGLIIIARFLRDPRTRGKAPIVALTMALSGGWWYLLCFDELPRYMAMSISQQFMLAERLAVYCLEAPELTFLGLLALVGIPATLRAFPGARWGILLLGATLVFGAGALLFWFDTHIRYIIPLHGVAMVLACSGAAGILTRISPGVHKWALALALLVLVGFSCWANLGPIPHESMELYGSRGLISSNPHDYKGLHRAHAWIMKQGRAYLLVSRDPETAAWTSDQRLAAVIGGEPPAFLSLANLRRVTGGAAPVFAVEARSRHHDSGSGDRHSLTLVQVASGQWLLEQDRVGLARFSDDSGVTYTVYRISKPRW